MEKRTHFNVSRKHPLTWLMALCLVGSAVARIVIACMKGTGDSLEVWSQIVLPVAATLLYVLIVLLNGKEFFFKTAIPVWMLGIYYAIMPHTVIGSNPFILGMYYTCIASYCILYTAITCGRIRFVWLLVPMFLAPLGAMGYLCVSSGDFWATVIVLDLLPNILLFLGGFLLCFAIKVSPAGKYHPTWGDRPDGRKIRTLAPMAQITAYFQVERNTCSNLFEESFEITNIDRYIRQKRREGLTDFGITHVLLAAYVRGVAKYPQLNRFISGQ